MNVIRMIPSGYGRNTAVTELVNSSRMPGIPVTAGSPFVA
jgi:hypothetical protein